MTIRRPMLALSLGMLMFAAVLGGSLGLMAAHASRQVNLVQGVQYYGPRNAAVTPAKFVSCLGTDWAAVYFYDTANKRWLHFFPVGGGAGQVPEWVNSPEAGGFALIPHGSAVALVMKVAKANATLPDRPEDVCP
jgi:hypothetical protein